MKIVYLHQYFKTPASNGGIRSYHFARALTMRGHDVHVVTSDTSVEGPAESVSQVDGITVHYLHVPYSNSMSFTRRIRAFLDFAVRASIASRRLRADVVVATSTPLTIAMPALWATFGRRARFVFEVRDLWPTVPIEMGLLRNPVLIAAARLLERITYRRADKIIALSEGMARGVADAGVSKDKIVVIPNIADIETFADDSPPPSTASRFVENLGDRPVVLYCGTFGRVNGLQYMVELAEAALALGSDLAFVAVGEGAEREAVVSEARGRGVLGKTFFALSPVTKQELPALFRSATFGSSWVIDVPALEHNSANKFFDTLAAHRPLLINHGGWQADALEQSGAGWRLDRDPQIAIEQLNTILSEPGAVMRAGAAARALAEQEYALTVLSDRFSRAVAPPPASS